MASLAFVTLTANAKSENTYLQSKLRESPSQQLRYFSINAIRYCRKTGVNIEGCLRNLTPRQINQLFRKKPKHTYASCLAVNEYCDPKVIFGPQCCGNLVCTGIPPLYNVSKCSS